MSASRDVTSITDFTIDVARRAGRLALEGFRRHDLGIEAKADFHDLVTKYDGACEALIREAILSAYPGSTIVGEEEGASAGDGELTWYVDPIDGTANFARGIAMWAVSIGVEIDGEIAIGVIYDPVADHMFWADDRGAFLGDTPISSTGAPVPDGATIALCFPQPRDLEHDAELVLEQFGRVTREYAQIRYLGSTCIALAWIAAGWTDGTVCFGTNPWDVAAGLVIVRRAGGDFRGYRDGDAAPAQAHLAPHYYAAVAGADYGTLVEIMETQSRLKDERARARG